jgi:hypothetical protein
LCQNQASVTIHRPIPAALRTAEISRRRDTLVLTLITNHDSMAIMLSAAEAALLAEELMKETN